MALTPHALQRGLGKLALGTARDIERKRKGNAPNRLTEAEQQFQIPIGGTATAAPTWVEKEIDFAFSFYNATGQRDSDLTEPQIGCGFKLESGTPVIVSAIVMKWDRKDADEIEGATIAVCAFDPAGGPSPFRGSLHISFQGYGALRELQLEDLE